ncbi:U32 family peptidase, partial [Nanoarchaeota archaeon]
LPFHVSTQASISNFESAKRFYKMGAQRVILARELSLKQIKEIKKKIKKEKLKLEVECFVHGAMCVSVSGRCFISQQMFKRSANRGDCLQPCRREYVVTDEEGNKLKVGNNYVLSPKDLCALPILDKLAAAGINCFKIEGRNRSPEYVKAIVESYRKAVDKKLSEKEIKGLIKKMKTVYNRDFSTGFYLGTPTADDFTNLYGSAATHRKEYVGYVKNYYKTPSVAEIKVESSSFKSGESLMFQGNKTGVHEMKVKSIELNHKKVKEGRKGQRIAVKTNKVVRENDKVFVIKTSS